MKRYLKILCGCVLTASICVPVFAEDISVLFNQVRIHCIDDGNVTSWGENIDGRSDMPSSILYNGTTYVPLRWISENMEKTVVWNGDSKTVGITEKDISYTNNELTTKADLNGNKWTYSIVNGKYLSILDKERNYERRYKLTGNNAYKIDDDAIWFVRGDLFRLPFLNDENSQDGQGLYFVGHEECGMVTMSEFDGDYLYVAGMRPGNIAHGCLTASNINTHEKTFYHLPTGTFITSLEIKSSDEDSAVIEFKDYHMDVRNIHEITFLKKTGEFGKCKLIDTSYNKWRNMTLKDFEFVKRNMELDEIYYLFGTPRNFVDKHNCIWDYYTLSDGTEIQFRNDRGRLGLVYLETSDCVRVELEFRSDGTLNIEN